MIILSQSQTVKRQTKGTECTKTNYLSTEDYMVKLKELKKWYQILEKNLPIGSIMLVEELNIVILNQIWWN